VFPDKASKSAQLFSRAAAALPGGVARHPVMFPPYLIYAADASGCRVTDVDGTVRIDFTTISLRRSMDTRIRQLWR
jgi:glutamate-1-semialdehyde 2,1-aminomutase